MKVNNEKNQMDTILECYCDRQICVMLAVEGYKEFNIKILELLFIYKEHAVNSIETSKLKFLKKIIYCQFIAT
jgi:hypothetical protein